MVIIHQAAPFPSISCNGQTNMSWKTAVKAELTEICNFVQKDEWEHVAFTSRILKDRKPYFPSPGKAGIYINRKENIGGKINDCIMITSNGLLVPVLNKQTLENIPEDLQLEKIINRNGIPIRTIMGEERSILHIERTVKRNRLFSVNYFLMKRVVNDKIEDDPGKNLKTKQATIFDITKLNPLQKGYEIEEVLLDPSKFNPVTARMLLKKTVKTEIVYYTEYKGYAIAKAGTNSQGINFDQIGGVYTIPEYRGKGISAYPLTTLINRISSRNKHASLFVRKNNKSAINLYLRTGFNFCGSYRISYYN